jgi:Ca2+-binding RTX toxin-like protein
MIIIRKDTVWGPGLKVLSDDIQIAPGAKLTLQAGAYIEGNGHSISAYGSFVSAGTSSAKNLIKNTHLDFGVGYDNPSSINIDHTQIDGGSLLAPGVAGYGNIKLTNSIITNPTSMIYLWYNTGKNIISGNIFTGNTKVSIGSQSNSENNIEIDHNVFASAASLEAWASYGQNVIYSHDNAFDYNGRTVITIAIDGQLKSRNDYFGTTDLTKVHSVIRDGRDDLGLNEIDISSISKIIPTGVKSDLFSFTSIALPQATIFDAKLLGSANASLIGNSFDNKLTGNIGNNTIDGGLGADTMSGGAGNDTYIVDNVGDGVVESSNKGTDSVVASVSYALSANVEALTLTGAKAINATGNALANHLIGNGAANVLDGKGGADVMAGGAGNDTYLVDHKADRIVEAFGAGTDTLVSTVSYALAAGQAVETLQFAKTVGTAALDLTGNEFANTLVGSAGDNVLNGGGGADALYGGSGNDTYVVDNLNDKVSEAKGAGTDAVLSSVSYALKGGQEIESLQLLASTGSAALNLTGNEFAQSLRGNAGANVLNGGLGNDVLTGGKGADTFAFSTALGSTHVDRITDFAAEDTVRLSKSIFSAIAPGQLADGAFKSVAAISTAKLDADDRILYKQATGELFYDADGSGTAAAVKFAVLDNKAALTHADFLIA